MLERAYKKLADNSDAWDYLDEEYAVRILREIVRLKGILDK
jgi:hypothetical protein